MQAKRPTPELRKLVPAYWPSPLSPLPSPLSPSLSPSRTRRRGISLLEVLAAIGVLSVGLLGLAALLPIGIFTIGEATKADRAGQCGRAALRDIVVRRMLDSSYWTRKPRQLAVVPHRSAGAEPPSGPDGRERQVRQWRHRGAADFLVGQQCQRCSCNPL